MLLAQIHALRVKQIPSKHVKIFFILNYGFVCFFGAGKDNAIITHSNVVAATGMPARMVNLSVIARY